MNQSDLQTQAVYEGCVFYRTIWAMSYSRLLTSAAFLSRRCVYVLSAM